MTDLPFSDDELLSSYLDGELTDEEQDRVEDRLGTDPGLAARLDALRSAAALAATAVPALRAGDTDRLIAAALAATDSLPNDAGSTVTDLGAARTRRSAPWRSRLAAVAAAVALVALSVPALRSFDWSSGDVSDTASTEADDAGGTFDAETLATQSAEAPAATPDEAEAAAADGSGTDFDATDDTVDAAERFDAYAALGGQNGAFDPLPDALGAFADLAALRTGTREAWAADRLRDANTTLAPATTPPVDEGAAPSSADVATGRSAAAAYLDQFGGCGSAIDSVSALAYSAAPVAVDYATATIGDEPVTVALLGLVDGSGVLIVLDTDGCTIRYDEVLLGP